MSEKDFDKKSPAETASFWSKIFLWWVTPVYLHGYKKGFGIEDLYRHRSCDSAEILGNTLQKEWLKELKGNGIGRKPSLVKAAFRAFGLRYLWLICLAIFGDCIARTSQAIFLGYIIRYYDKSVNTSCEKSWRLESVFTNHGEEITDIQHYYAAAGICIATAFYVLTYHRYFYGIHVAGMILRIGCSTMVYRKALRLSKRALGETTIGQMVNLLSNDVSKFDQALAHIPYVLVGPLHAVVVVTILWQYLGISCLAGISLMILFIPFQGLMARLFSKLRTKTLVLTDERIRLMNEIVSGMKTIKMYTWEKAFANLVAHTRKREVDKIRLRAILQGVNSALIFVLTKVILLLAFLTYSVVSPCPLTAETAFVSLTLFNSLRLSMTLFFSNGLAQGSEALVSFRRLQHFLLLNEKDDSEALDASTLCPSPNQCGLWMQNVTAKWNNAAPECSLMNINVTARPGELLAVVGPVGSGKSSLLMAILGELPLSGGTLQVRGKVAYVPQDSCVFAGDIRSNIIFGQEYKKEKYEKVIQVCALNKDLEEFPYGDRTQVGDRGASLSGGQKARVNLARALYLDADIYLLDDPLSAVDVSVAKHLFDKCINGYLKNKTRILVTHQLQFLKTANRILFLKAGNCLACESYSELSKQGLDIASLLDLDKEKNVDKDVQREFDVSDSRNTKDVLSSLEMDLIEGSEETKPVELKIIVDAPGQKEEYKSTGSIDSSVYWKFISAGFGPYYLVAFLIVSCLSQATFNGLDFWLSTWDKTMSKSTPDQENCTKTGIGAYLERVSECQGTYFFVHVYACLFGILFFFSLARSVMFFTRCTTTSKVLHNSMFNSLIRAPISFFDQNAIGRILNRFSRDIGTVDDLIPITALDILSVFFSVIGSLVVSGIVNQYLIIPAAVLLFLFFFIRKFYIRTARDIRRVEGITRSPVLSHISTSLNGLTTIRAFKVQTVFEKEFYFHQDQHTRSGYLLICGTVWIGMVLDLICVFYIVILTVALVNNSEDFTDGQVGLAISTTLLLCGITQWGVRQSAEIENQMVSVERILEYKDLKSEANLETDADSMPPKGWPQEGRITFSDMSLTYFPEHPPVLKNLNCSIQPMEKVGIVGRTGAGKSSLISALFRMCEPEGTINIDGIDTKSIGLQDLRSKISIIPQDPVLFTGSVRDNLDPFKNYDDTSLWNVLEEVHLKDVVVNLPGGLNSFLFEGGSNFSVGQRQLICIARAILRNNRILVLDEATANVDTRTDALIQHTIKSKFSHCTVLTIAHRLDTIMDSDRVMVLDGGTIKEFREPYKLLEDEDSFLYNMVKKTGSAMMEHLIKVARNRSELKSAPYPVQKNSDSKTHSPEALQKLSGVKSSVPIGETENSTVKNLEKVQDSEES